MMLRSKEMVRYNHRKDMQQDMIESIYEQANMQERIKVLHTYYVTENKLMTKFEFTFSCVKVLIGMYSEMSLMQAKAFVDNSLV